MDSLLSFIFVAAINLDSMHLTLKKGVIKFAAEIYLLKVKGFCPVCGAFYFSDRDISPSVELK